MNLYIKITIHELFVVFYTKIYSNNSYYNNNYVINNTKLNVAYTRTIIRALSGILVSTFFL